MEEWREIKGYSLREEKTNGYYTQCLAQSKQECHKVSWLPCEVKSKITEFVDKENFSTK